MEQLPEDMFFEFLTRIPTKDVLRSMQVSRSWQKIASQEYFCCLHADRFPSDLDANTPLFITSRRIDTNLFIISICLAQDSSLGKPKPRIRDIIINNQSVWDLDMWCNDFWISNACCGLLCIRQRNLTHPIIMCNPLTLEHTTLPPCFTEEGICVSGSVGFGFSPSTKEYKAVVIALDLNFKVQDEVGGLPGKIMAHTLGSDEPHWRHLKDVYFYQRKGPVYAAGKLYWIIYDVQRSKSCLVSFDVGSEKLSEIDNVPALVRGLNDMDYNLREFRGRISTIFIQDSCMEIWTLNLKDCNKGYWERIHKIELPREPDRTQWGFARLVGLWDRGDDMLQIWLQDAMILYDKRKDSKERCTMYKGPDLSLNKWDLYTGYKPSFVSLKRIGCESKDMYVDMNRYMELPPNCHSKRVVIDLDLDL